MVPGEGPFLPHKQGDILRGHGPAEEIPLHLVAPQRTQELELFKGFHSLGDYLKVQAVRQADNGP